MTYFDIQAKLRTMLDGTNGREDGKLDIALVIFDMDGLLFDTERLAFHGWRRAAAELGFEITEELFLKTVGVSSEGTDRIYIEKFGPGFPAGELRKRRWEITERYIADFGVPMKDGAYDLLVRLKADGFMCALATSTVRKRVEPMLSSAGIARFFDRTVCGDEIVRPKPDPEIFLKAAAALKTAPWNCLVFEDSFAGVTAAHAAGMHPVMVPDLLEPTAEILSLAYRKLDSLDRAIPFFDECIVAGTGFKNRT